jgi:hypothetical protein
MVVPIAAGLVLLWLSMYQLARIPALIARALGILVLGVGMFYLVSACLVLAFAAVVTRLLDPAPLSVQVRAVVVCCAMIAGGLLGSIVYITGIAGFATPIILLGCAFAIGAGNNNARGSRGHRLVALCFAVAAVASLLVALTLFL